MAGANWIEIGGLLTAIVGLGAIFFQIRSATVRNKRQATLDFWTATLERREQWRAVLPDDRNAAAVAEFVPPADDPTNELNKTIAAYLNYYEAIATGVHLGIYDVTTIDYLAGPRVIKLYNSYRGWISARRQYFDEGTLFIEFELLAREIEQRRQRRPVR